MWHDRVLDAASGPLMLEVHDFRAIHPGSASMGGPSDDRPQHRSFPC